MPVVQFPDYLPSAERVHCCAARPNMSRSDWMLPGGSVFKQDRSHGRNALHLASIHGHAPVVKTLLSAGAPINAADPGGASALQLAVEAQQLGVIEELLRAGGRLSAAGECQLGVRAQPRRGQAAGDRGVGLRLAVRARRATRRVDGAEFRQHGLLVALQRVEQPVQSFCTLPAIPAPALATPCFLGVLGCIYRPRPRPRLPLIL